MSDACSIAGCGKPRACRGWCWTHYDRWRRNGDPLTLGPRGERGTVIQDPEQRFWSKVDKTEGCWLWTGKTSTRGGYGSFYAHGKAVLAHRLSWEKTNGPIPDGMVIDHLCRETRCINPEHLEVVTLQENSRRAGKARGETTRCGYGHELAGINLRTRKDGGRYCGECANQAQRERRARKRAIQAAASWLEANPDSEGSAIMRDLLQVIR